MAKRKQQTTGYVRPVANTREGDEWSTGRFDWQWGGGVGINLSVKRGDAWQMVVHAKTLAEAGIFAEGFEAGFEHGLSEGTA